MEKNEVLVKWIVEKVWIKDSSVKNHKEALNYALNELTTAGYWLSTINWIWHRAVHGGEYFKNPVVITDEVMAKITECSDLAPLHNPANLEAMLACKELFPNLQQVAVFDTAFYQEMTPEHYLYALPMKYYETYKIRRYWFHGISHQYIYEKLIADYNVPHAKVITCHVGNWVSITAIDNGKVIDTSMGMTPLEWVMMGTRSGSIDPAIIPYLMNHEHFDADQIDTMLNKQSWLLGISWISSDMRDILTGVEKWDTKCVLALNMYVNSLVKYIWAYTALLWGVDVIVLTAGVMEHRAIIRKILLERLWYLWITLDATVNQDELPGGAIISTSDSKVAVIVIPTNEELMIAKKTFDLITK